MITNKKNKIQYLAQASMIAAIYVVLTYISSIFGLSYGPIQLRLSEALTVLPIFTSAAIPGLTVGCLIANLSSPNGILDIVFGTLATLIGAFGTSLFKNISFKNIPFLSLLSPVLTNAVIISAILTAISIDTATLAMFLTFLISIGSSEFVSCFCLGIPLIFILRKYINIKRLD